MVKIFMADDDSLLVHIYDKKFKANGYDIEFSMDGEEAISKLKNMEIKPADRKSTRLNSSHRL